jgi:DnaJ family protein B protein 6
MADPFFPDPWRRGRRHDSYHQRGRGFFDDPSIGMGFPFERGFDDRVNAGGRTRAYSQVSRSALTPDGRWVAESRVTRTVNGVTESVWKRKDGAVRSTSHPHR